MLQLEVGKYYKNRKGEKIGPIIDNLYSLAGKFEFTIFESSNNNETWTIEGKVWSCETSQFDLIEEWKDEETEKSTFKIEHEKNIVNHDSVNHPQHYTSHPSGVECIQITRYMGFNLGNAMKYIWRADLKNGLEDLEKAKWYIQDEIDKRKAQS